jgi:hypothetical protein
MKLVIAASSRKPVGFGHSLLLANRPCVAAKLWQHGSAWLSTLRELNSVPQRRT